MLKKRGIWAILGVITIFAILHFGFAPEGQEPKITGAIFIGGVAFILMTTAIVLSTRLDALEDLFGGLDRMYQVHRIVGSFAGIFVLFHFFGAPKQLPSGVDVATNSMTPSAPLGMLAMIFLVIGLFISLNRKISYSKWRPAHKIMGLIYIMVYVHFVSAPNVLFSQFSLSGIFLMAIGAVGIIAFLYSVLGMNRATAIPYTLEKVTALERATELTLTPKDKKLEFNPGQFAFIEIKNKGWHEPHPFTISSAPEDDQLRFTIKVLGDWTRKIREELEPGVEVMVRGPYGRFNAKNAPDKQLWIAGGIGITPFLSKIRSMSTDDNRDVTLIYATRNKEEALFMEEIATKAKSLKNFTLINLFSDEGQFVQIDTIKEKLATPLKEYAVFMCGPKPMIDKTSKALRKEKVKHKNIHKEAFEFR